MSTIIGQDEQKIKEVTFTVNLILFWLKSNYVLTNKRVTGHTPNTLLGLIPLGKKQITQPLKTIASVTSSTKFFFMRLLIGSILVMLGLVFLSDIHLLLLSAILLLLGVINILNCYTATFVITNNGGQRVGYEISILEKSKVEEFVNAVNTVIADV